MTDGGGMLRFFQFIFLPFNPMSKKLKILIGVLLVVALLVIAAVFIFDGKYGSGRLMRGPRGTGSTRAAEGTIVPCPEDSKKACCEGTIGECRVLCTAEPGGCWRMIAPGSKVLRQ